MSRLLARIMLALLMVPVATLLYVLMAVTMHETITRRDETVFLTCGITTTLFVAVWWTLLWFRSVRWSVPRRLFTIGGTVVAIAVGLIVALVATTVDDDFAAFIGPPAAIFTWLTLTVFIWRDTSGERAVRVERSGIGAVVCPACGYNLTGLRQTTCPECGAAYTIDELVAQQPGRESAAIEAGVSQAA